MKVPSQQPSSGPAHAPQKPDAEAASQRSADETGSIEVTVDRHGTVQDVLVLDDWREHLSPAEFPQALFQAYVLAMRLVESARAAAPRTPPRPLDVKPAIPPELALPQTPEAYARWRAAVREALVEIDRKVQRIEALETAMRATEHTVTGPGGYLSLRIRGRSIVRIDGNEHRIDAAPDQLLRHDALTLLRKHGFRFGTPTEKGQR